MSVIGLLGAIAGFVKVRYLNDKAIIDSPIFRLHYRVTSAIFFASCILVTAFDLFGKPIDCIVDYDFKRMDALNTYCWTQSTFTLVRNNTPFTVGFNAHPNVGPQQTGDGKRFHAYYQWVPFVLFIQGILFYVPHWIWKQWEGKKISHMTDSCRGFNLNGGEERRARCSAVSLYLRESINTNGRLALAYISCEVLNFVNAVTNIFLINRFLGGAFLKYGVDVVRFSDQDQENRFDPMIEVFPRMTKCVFHQYGPSGGIMNIDALCLLPLNIIHEKIYIFFWFWLIILSVVSAVALAFRILTVVVPDARLYDLRRNTSPSQSAAMAVIFRMPYGDYFLLHLLAKNVQGFFFNALIDDLAEHFGYIKKAGEAKDSTDVELLKLNPYRRNSLIIPDSSEPADYKRL